MDNKYKLTRIACFTAYYTMASVFSLPPLLFVTFHKMYGVSWTLLGTLVLTNFCTQLLIDLIFTVFSKKFNVPLVVKIMPLITALGLAIYALSPVIFADNVYIGLLIGTVIFSVSAGLSEVLLSPTIAALPSKNPQRDMSLLHSLYAFGVFSVVVIGALFIEFVGSEYWMYLTLFFAALPIIAAVMFSISPMPDMNNEEITTKAVKSKKRTKVIILCVACIFLGACAENVMTNWISSYMETELNIDKAIGDILGMAMFAVLIGIVRICYAKWGKNIKRAIFIGMLGATICYLVAGISSNIIMAFMACLLTGVFTAMLWPGTLMMMEEKIASAGVALYALMAAGGDLGASIAPQLMGILADNYSLKTGMLVCATFPFMGVILMLIVFKVFKGKEKL